MKFEMDIPEELAGYLQTSNKLQEIERNALLIYPYLCSGHLSVRRAAEIVGMNFLTLGKFYYERNLLPYPGDRKDSTLW